MVNYSKIIFFTIKFHPLLAAQISDWRARCHISTLLVFRKAGLDEWRHEMNREKSGAANNCQHHDRLDADEASSGARLAGCSSLLPTAKPLLRCRFTILPGRIEKRRWSSGNGRPLSPPPFQRWRRRGLASGSQGRARRRRSVL